MREIGITIIAPSTTDVSRFLRSIQEFFESVSPETMIDIHICPAEVAEENE